MTKFKKMSKGKRAAVIIAAVLGAALIIGLIVSAVMPEPGESVNLVRVEKRDMLEKLSVTGEIESDGDTLYSIYTGTKVLTVNVKEGDTVKKGDVLATFDSSEAAAQTAQKQEAYNKAKQAYDAAVAQKTDSANQLAGTNARIAELEKEIAALEKELSAMGENMPEMPDIDVAELLKKISQMTEEELKKLLEVLINFAPSAGDSADKIAAVAGKISQLISDRAELAQLKVQKELLSGASQLSVEDVLKLAMDSAAADLKKSREKQALISKGWVAEGDGLVTKVSVKAGEVFGGASSEMDISSLFSALSGEGMDMSAMMGMLAAAAGPQTGLVVSDTNQYVATFTAGKYDILRLEVGQKAKITTVSGTFDGEIIYISPTASSSSGSFDLGALTGGLTGGSSSAGCKVKVSIESPDRSVIEGFDVDIDIMLGEGESVLSIPVEALIPDSKSKSVYVYDPETKTVSVRQVVFGTTDDSFYQVKNGLDEGELIVKNPPTSLTDGARVTVSKDSPVK